MLLHLLTNLRHGGPGEEAPPPLSDELIEDIEDTRRFPDFSAYLDAITPPPPPPPAEPLPPEEGMAERSVDEDEVDGAAYYPDEQEVGEGPVAHWTFDADATSEIGVYPVAMINNPVVRPTSGIIGGALELNGTNQYLDIGDQDGVLVTPPLTYTIWLRPDTITGQRGIISKISNQTALGILVEQMDHQVRIYLDGFQPKTWHSSYLSVGAWRFCAVVVDAPTVRLYRDGVQVASGIFETVSNFTGGGFLVGRQTNLPRYFDGMVDDFRVYNRALSDQEILDLYQEAVP